MPIIPSWHRRRALLSSRRRRYRLVIARLIYQERKTPHLSLPLSRSALSWPSVADMAFLSVRFPSYRRWRSERESLVCPDRWTAIKAETGGRPATSDSISTVSTSPFLPTGIPGRTVDCQSPRCRERFFRISGHPPLHPCRTRGKWVLAMAVPISRLTRRLRLALS